MGDRSFEDLLVRVFGLEPDLYVQGQGTTLVARDRGGAPFLTLEKALIEKSKEGNWWQLVLETEFDRMFLEVLVGVEQAPLVIRYISPATGQSHEIIPEMGRQIQQARETMTTEQIRGRLDSELANEVQQTWGFIFGLQELLGEEIIETEAGMFRAVHIRDTKPGPPPGVTDYWLSPDVPGQILRSIVSIPDSTDKVVTELEEIRNGVSRMIDPESIIPID